MPVNSTHPHFAAHIDQWQRCRDVLCGQDAVHAAGERYLPKLKEQPQEEYDAYKKRASFYNATGRTVSGLKGMLLRKPPIVEVPDAVKPLLEDVTLSGVPFPLFLDEVCYEALGLGRLGILVDYPPAADDVATLADAQRLQLQPTMQLYRAEAIINWRCAHVGAVYALTMVVLKEKTPVVKDEYQDTYEDRYRVLDLDAAGDYRVRVFKVTVDGQEEQVGADLYPLMANNKLRYIPFTFLGPDGTRPEPEEPPLLDLVNLNLSHYRTGADLEHGAHYTGLPTPWIAGYTEQLSTDGKPQKLYIGGTAAWVFNDPQAKAQYLEFTGVGLGTLVSLLEAKEKQMAVQGARMLEPRVKGVESAEAAAIHRKGEESLLAAQSQAISQGVTLALRWFVAWAGADATEAKATLTTDFYPLSMTAQMLTALMSAWQQGGFSDQTLFTNLQAAEIIAADTTLEEEQARKNTAPPSAVPTDYVPPGTKQPPAAGAAP